MREDIKNAISELEDALDNYADQLEFREEMDQVTVIEKSRKIILEDSVIISKEEYKDFLRERKILNKLIENGVDDHDWEQYADEEE